MSRILVIEPRNLLRQAIRLALFPDHEVQMTALPEDGSMAADKFDLVIIDSTALSRQVVRAVQGWNVPTIWIDDNNEESASTRGKRVLLTIPIQRETLQSLVATCLSNSAKQNGVKVATKETRTAKASQISRAQIIELVDVVEEPAATQHTKRQR